MLGDVEIELRSIVKELENDLLIIKEMELEGSKDGFTGKDGTGKKFSFSGEF